MGCTRGEREEDCEAPVLRLECGMFAGVAKGKVCPFVGDIGQGLKAACLGDVDRDSRDCSGLIILHAW